MSSNGHARVAETCDTRDFPSQLQSRPREARVCIRTAGADMRVARLRYENERLVELMTVSSILDCELGCTIKHASEERMWKTSGELAETLLH